MKLLVVTDMEGVAGITNYEDWCEPAGIHYRRGLELTTLEVNAAVAGFFEGGATEITVVDGHGKGGISMETLDPRVALVRGRGETYPMGLDPSFDAVAWVGQHAKAGTPYSHLTHTQSFAIKDLRLNGVSIGEFGQGCYGAMEMGVRTLFAAGEKALALEAELLVPGVFTTWGKRGLLPDALGTLTAEAYAGAKLGAWHMPLVRSRERLREKAREAALAFGRSPSGLFPASLEPPYTLEVEQRGNTASPEPRRFQFTNDSIQGVMFDFFDH